MLNYSPDIDATSGVLTDVVNCLPTINGLQGAPSPVDTIWFADYVSDGMATVDTLSGIPRTFVGEQNYILEAVSGGMALVGSGWLPGSGRFMFTSFGNAVLVVNGWDGVRLSASTGAGFAGIAGAPKANIIEGVGLFVMAFNTNDGTDHNSDGWWCSALGDYTDWTPSITNQCANGRFLDSPGAVTAGRRLGDGIVAYKKRAMYMGQYVGGDVIWQWSQVATNIGCVGQDAVVNAGGVHYFIGADDIYRYEGAQPQSIAGGIKRWFFADADPARISNIIGVHDRNSDHVWFWYSSTTCPASKYDKAIVYNIVTGMWGKVLQTCYDVMTYQSGTDTLTIMTDHEGGFFPLKTLSGACAAASITTGDYGDDDQYSSIERVRTRYRQAPTSASMQHSYRAVSGIAYTVGETSASVDQKFNFGKSSRWHRFVLSLTGDFEITAIKPIVSVPNGKR